MIALLLLAIATGRPVFDDITIDSMLDADAIVVVSLAEKQPPPPSGCELAKVTLVVHEVLAGAKPANTIDVTHGFTASEDCQYRAANPGRAGASFAATRFVSDVDWRDRKANPRVIAFLKRTGDGWRLYVDNAFTGVGNKQRILDGLARRKR